MRFLLLARARATGVVRLLSDRAFDSRSAAVDAATGTARTMDLGDDEVLAVDLDKAGPVLVLRVEVPAPAEVPRPGSVPPRPAPFAWPSPATAEPAVSLQPRFPLFGAQGEEDETLADSLRRIARRMESDLTAGPEGEWSPHGERDDARPAEDAPVEASSSFDSLELLSAREEGTRLMDAAELLHEMQAFDAADADVHSGDGSGSAAEAGETPDRGEEPIAVEDAPFAPAEPFEPAEDDVLRFDDGAEPEAGWVILEPEAGSVDDDRPGEPDTSPDRVDEQGPRVDAFEPDLPAEERAETEQAWSEPPAVAPLFVAEVPSYRPSGTDFAIWVCADCVYQRTCRRAGMSTPATCGNFLWRSS